MAHGLRENSRVMMKIGKQKLSYEQKMLALIFDALQIIAFKQGHRKGTPKPQSLLNKLTKENAPKDELLSFTSAEAFDEWRSKKMKG